MSAALDLFLSQPARRPLRADGERMYPGVGSTRNNYYAVITLPDGRKVDAQVTATYEYDTNGGDVTGSTLCWVDNEEELTADECNEELVIGGKPYYLHEYVIEQAMLTTPE